ncbi:MAG: hypothetical protein JO257_31810 [Deltaproteobacteria bacterium]|nr:hypothetical protein [Deltaproteobacteria bacterium]
MGEAVRRSHRHALARTRRRRDDLWVGATALVAAMLALPLAPSSWHGPEVASVLAVSATALLAGQRWAVALVVIAELLLLPTIWPRAFLGGVDIWPGRIAALGSLVAIVPGLLANKRAAAALVLITGWRRTGETCRRVHAGLVAGGVLIVLLSLL